jgi:hypothetical protein
VAWAGVGQREKPIVGPYGTDINRDVDGLALSLPWSGRRSPLTRRIFKRRCLSEHGPGGLEGKKIPASGVAILRIKTLLVLLYLGYAGLRL